MTTTMKNGDKMTNEPMEDDTWGAAEHDRLTSEVAQSIEAVRSGADYLAARVILALRSGGARRLANKLAKIKPADYYDDSNRSMRKLRADVKDKLVEIQKYADAKAKKAADRERARKFRASHPRSASMYFLNTGPDASHFTNDTRIFYKLGDVKAAVKDLDHDRWVVTRRDDRTNTLSVVKAGNAAYRNAAQRYADKVNGVENLVSGQDRKGAVE